MQHLDEGTIHAWLDGALPPLEAEQAAQHVEECVSCAAAVAEARGIIAGSARIVSALDDVPGGVIPGRTTRPASGSSAWRRLRLTPGRAALAATILVAVSATLTLRSSSTSLPESKVDSVAFPATAPKVAAAPAPTVARAMQVDSIKVPGPSSTNAPAMRKVNAVASLARTQTVAERRESAKSAIADAGAGRDTIPARELSKARVAAQEAVAGATAPAVPPSAPTAVAARGALVPANALDQRADSASAFEGCYRLSADSSSGVTEMPSGLPASFALTRPSPDAATTRRAFAARPDSSFMPLAWRQLSTTQASVTFGTTAGRARPVSLVLTAGSPVGVASSGDRTTRVRVSRAACPR